MGKVLAALYLLLVFAFVEQSFAQSNCTASGGKCLTSKKCNNSVPVPGSPLDCPKKKVCCQLKQCPGTCIFRPNCKPIIARVPFGPYQCPKGEVCCEDIDVPKCPGNCIRKKKCLKQGNTIQSRPHDCPRMRVCCV